MKVFFIALAMLCGEEGIIYLYNVLFARLLGPEAYGDFTVTINGLYLLATVSLLGFDSALVRFIPKYLLDRKNWGYIHGYIRYELKLLVTVSIFVLFLWLINISIVNQLALNNNFLNSKVHVVWFFVWLVPFLAIIRLYGQLLRVVEQIIIFMFTTYMARYIGFILVAAIVLLFEHKVTIGNLLLGFAIFSLIIIAIQGFLFYKNFPKEIFSYNPQYNKRAWSDMALNMLLYNLTFLYYDTFYLIILEMFGNNEANVGIFAAILAIADLTWLGNTAINSTTLTKLSIAVVEKDNKRLQSLLNKNMLASLMVAIIVTIVLIFWGKTILGVFGPEFINGYKVLLILAGTCMVEMVAKLYTSFLQISEYHHKVMYFTIIKVVIALISGIVLINKMDILGAAISMAISAAFMWLSSAHLCKRHLALKPLGLF